MNDPDPQDRARRLRGRARLLEFLKFRVLASQESFFAAWRLQEEPAEMTGSAAALPPLDLVAFRQWLQPLWPEAGRLDDEDLRHCLEQAQRLYVDPGPAQRR